MSRALLTGLRTGTRVVNMLNPRSFVGRRFLSIDSNQGIRHARANVPKLILNHVEEPFRSGSDCSFPLPRDIVRELGIIVQESLSRESSRGCKDSDDLLRALEEYSRNQLDVLLLNIPQTFNPDIIKNIDLESPDVGVGPFLNEGDIRMAAANISASQILGEITQEDVVDILHVNSKIDFLGPHNDDTPYFPDPQDNRIESLFLAASRSQGFVETFVISNKYLYERLDPQSREIFKDNDVLFFFDTQKVITGKNRRREFLEQNTDNMFRLFEVRDDGEVESNFDGTETFWGMGFLNRSTRFSDEDCQRALNNVFAVSHQLSFDAFSHALRTGQVLLHKQARTLHGRKSGVDKTRQAVALPTSVKSSERLSSQSDELTR